MKRHRPARLAILLLIAICAGLAASVATNRLLKRLPTEISRTEFFSEVEQHHVAKVVIVDRELIEGTSSTRGAFRVSMPVDDATVSELRSRGVVVEFETDSNLIP
jgi:Flp pilus assembly protein CpaB